MDVPEKIYKNMKSKFDAAVKDLFLKTKKNSNNQILTKEDYFQTIEKLKATKAKQDLKHPQEYKFLRRFDIKILDGIERLIVPVKIDNPVTKYYVHMEEAFKIIYDTHVAHGHCGRNRMEKELNCKYKNITREMVRIFLIQCYICEQRRPISLVTDKDKVREVSSFEKMFPRCQVNVVDMKINQDGPYRYILVYEDYRTKFVQLRPLKTCGKEEVAIVLLQILTIFGAPSIIHSDNGREFAAEIVTELNNQWSDTKIVHGESQASSLNHCVLEMLDVWMKSNRMVNWSKCLHFVQFMKNKCKHRVLYCSPYEAMFRMQCRSGVELELSPSKLADLNTEEDLKLQFAKDGVCNIKMEAETNFVEQSMENLLTLIKQENLIEDESSVDILPPAKLIKLE